MSSSYRPDTRETRRPSWLKAIALLVGLLVIVPVALQALPILLIAIGGTVGWLVVQYLGFRLTGWIVVHLWLPLASLFGAVAVIGWELRIAILSVWAAAPAHPRAVQFADTTLSTVASILLGGWAIVLDGIVTLTLIVSLMFYSSVAWKISGGVRASRQMHTPMSWKSGCLLLGASTALVFVGHVVVQWLALLGDAGHVLLGLKLVLFVALVAASAATTRGGGLAEEYWALLREYCPRLARLACP